MASVYGSEVREPKITRRSALPVDKRSAAVSELARAWSSFGEAKEVLQKLESKEASPPVKDKRKKGAAMLRNNRRIKPYSVRFESHSEPLSAADAELDEKENVLDGSVLNDTRKLARTQGKGSPDKSPHFNEPRPIEDHLAAESVTNDDHIATKLSPKHDHMSTNKKSGESPQSFDVAHSSSPQQKPHSNPTALFGPVSFAAHRGTKTCKPTSSGATHPLPPSTALPPPPPTTAASSQAAPLRRFQLPSDTLSSLRSRVEQQKLAVQATGAKVGSLKPATEFYPLPEASASSSSLSTSSPPHSHLSPHPPPGPAPHHPHPSSSSAPSKKRKVASAPPPRTYTGFSAVETRPTHQTAHTAATNRNSTTAGSGLQWKTNQDRLGRPAFQATTERVSLAGSRLPVPPVPAVPTGRVRKVRRLSPPGESGAAKRPGATGFITPSSWRAGKEAWTKPAKKDGTDDLKHPTLSVEDREESCHAHSFDSSGVSGASVTSPASSQRLVASGDHQRKGEGLSSSLARLLEDLEEGAATRERSSEREDERGRQDSSRAKRYMPPSGTASAKKPRVNSEPVYPTQRSRHYDQAEVQLYMRAKQEDKRRRLQADRLAGERASQERQQRLKELYETQRKKVLVNLRRKQQEREAYARSISASVRITLHTSGTTSDSESLTGTPPTMTLKPRPPETPPPPQSSPRRLRAPHSSPSHLHTPHSPQASPPSHYHQPLDTRHSPYRSTSPLARSHTASKSPLSPLAHQRSSPPHSKYSPANNRAHHTSPFRSPTGVKVQVTPPSPLGTHDDDASPQTRGSVSPLNSSSSNRDERLEELTRSALKLKERIAKESRKYRGEHKTSAKQPSPCSKVVRELRFSAQQDLPGVSSLQEHTRRCERARREDAAAATIQAAYKGYLVRRSRQWRLPSGQTFGAAMLGGKRKEEHSVSAGNPSQRQPQGSRVESFDVQATSVSSSEAPLPVTSGGLVNPWEEQLGRGGGGGAGGDSLSVINIFTRQHQQLRESLAQLSSQKRAEIRQLQPALPAATTGGDPTTATIASMPPVAPSSVAPATLPSSRVLGLSLVADQHELSSPLVTEKTSSGYSYSQVFESASGGGGGQDFEDGSVVSSQFSQDSLQAPSDGATLQDAQVERSPSPVDSSATPTAEYSGQSTPMQSQNSDGISVITPPGSASFVSSFASQQKEDYPTTFTRRKEVRDLLPQPSSTGRLSPRSLELKHHAELNILESVEESVRQLSNVESTRAVSLAQQETVTLAQALKTKQQAHEREVEVLALKAKKEVEEAQKNFEKVHKEALSATDQMRRIKMDADLQSQEQTEKMAGLQAQSAKAAREATLQLADARSKATNAVIEAAQLQIQAAHTMATSAASAAAREAVTAALSSSQAAAGSESLHPLPGGLVADGTGQGEGAQSYASDFEPPDSTMQSDSLETSVLELDSTPVESENDDGAGTPTLSSVAEGLSEEGASGSSMADHSEPGVDQTLVEGEEGKGLSQSSDTTVKEDSNDIFVFDINEVSKFREILPSESHRRHHRLLGGSDSESRPSSPASSSAASRPRTPSDPLLSATLSPAAGEDSFFQFMTRMVQSYMREEELRSRHQTALLQLRQTALEEKTRAELGWLRLKKQQLVNRGADDLMPPLKRREKGLLRQLQHEQAEFERLKEVHQAASHERKLMLQQQNEISKIRKSTQYYREKIHKYSQATAASTGRHPSPSPDRGFSPAPSSTEGRSRRSLAESFSRASEAMEPALLSDREPSAAPSEDLEATSSSASFPTYPPRHGASEPPTADISEAIEGEDKPSTSTLEQQEHTPETPSGKTPSKSRSQTSTPKSDSQRTLKKLKKLASPSAEDYLSQRRQRLLQRRLAAEKALKQQEVLLEKERRLDQEEEEVNQMIDQALVTFQQRRGRTKHSATAAAVRRSPKSPVAVSPRPVGGATESEASLLQLPKTPPTESVSESIKTSSSVSEEISDSAVVPTRTVRTADSAVPSEYANDTFESLGTTLTPHTLTPHTLTTSTPAHSQRPLAVDTERLDDISESIKLSESLVTATSSSTSEGSVIEARIRQLQEQLRQERREANRKETELRRRKKAILLKQEQQLRKQLEALQSRPRGSPPPTITPSESERELSESPLPQLTPPLPTLPPPQERQRAGDTLLTQDKDKTPPTETTGENEPLLASPTSYTPFSEAVPATEGVSTELLLPRNVEPGSATEDEQVIEELSPSPELSSVTAESSRVPSVSPSPAPVEDVVPPEDQVQPPLRDGVLLSEGEESARSSLSHDSSSVAEQLSEPSEPLPSHSQVGPKPELQHSLPTSAVAAATPVENGEPVYSNTFEEDTSPIPSVEGKTGPLIETPPTEQPKEQRGFITPLQSERSEISVQLHQRVLVGNTMSGTIHFIGETHFAKGVWIGVELDMPKGRNDGSIDGERYFTCEPHHGLFAPPSKVGVLLSDETEEEGSSLEEELEPTTEEEEEEKEGDSPQEGKVDIVGGERIEDSLVREDSYTADFESEAAENDANDRKSDLSSHKKPTSLETPQILQHSATGEVLEDISRTEPASNSTEHPQIEAPSSDTLEILGKKPEDLPFAPDIVAQRSLSATPTPAPPPEFAEAVSRETSQEPPPLPAPTLPAVEEPVPLRSERHATSESITGELAQELSNEAFETIHRIWKNKKAPPVATAAATAATPVEDIKVGKAPSLEDKVDIVTDQLMSLLLRSETNLMCDIHSTKDVSKPTEAEKPESKSPTKSRAPAKLIIPPPGGFVIESSPPPLSPPSPYRTTPPVFPVGDQSPPGSPPRHLSQASAARVAAGDRTPFGTPLPLNDASSPSSTASTPRKSLALERSGSDTITQLLDSIRMTTAQCMVPSERSCVDDVVVHAWNTVQDVGVGQLHSGSFPCPEQVKGLFAGVREMSTEEDHCRSSYLQLVYNLSLEVMKSKYPESSDEEEPTWSDPRSRSAPLATNNKQKEVTLEAVQRTVYALLMQGQLPPQLPAVKFLRGTKRPCGREVDFVDTVLIRELREEEPGWVEYGRDEEAVKIKTADSILDSLLIETAEIFTVIARRKRHTQNDYHVV